MYLCGSRSRNDALHAFDVKNFGSPAELQTRNFRYKQYNYLYMLRFLFVIGTHAKEPKFFALNASNASFWIKP